MKVQVVSIETGKKANLNKTYSNLLRSFLVRKDVLLSLTNLNKVDSVRDFFRKTLKSNDPSKFKIVLIDDKNFNAESSVKTILDAVSALAEIRPIVNDFKDNRTIVKLNDNSSDSDSSDPDFDFDSLSEDSENEDSENEDSDS